MLTCRYFFIVASTAAVAVAVAQTIEMKLMKRVCVHSIIITHAHGIYICSDCSALIVQADSEESGRGRERRSERLCQLCVRVCVEVCMYKVYNRPNDAMPTLDD